MDTLELEKTFKTKESMVFILHCLEAAIRIRGYAKALEVSLVAITKTQIPDKMGSIQAMGYK